jgi:acetyl esterase/lipase
MKHMLACGVVGWVLMGTSIVVGAAEPVVLLWPDGAPGALGQRDADQPSLTVYRAPGEGVRAAIVVCPGGGYGGLAGHEGKDYALWLNARGLHAFVLKYRLGSAGYRHPRMLEDVQRAIRLVRSRSGEWGVDPGRVGVMGSSAGGHLASTALTHFDGGKETAVDLVDRYSSRPDLGILCYPVITMGAFTHTGSRGNLLGDAPSPELIGKLSSERQVTAETPPTFLWHTVEDTVVPVENSLMFAEALRKAKVPFALHVFEKGRHGLGLAGGHPWTVALELWLTDRGFMENRASGGE